MDRFLLTDAQWEKMAPKEFKRIALRRCKTDTSFAAMI